MQFSSIATALLLPLLAVAQDSTTTCTSTQYLTKTVTLSRVHTATMTYNNSTASYMPTGVISSSAVPSGTTEPTLSPTINAGSALDAANVAVLAVAGMVVAALI